MNRLLSGVIACVLACVTAVTLVQPASALIFDEKETNNKKTGTVKEYSASAVAYRLTNPEEFPGIHYTEIDCYGEKKQSKEHDALATSIFSRVTVTNEQIPLEEDMDGVSDVVLPSEESESVYYSEVPLYDQTDYKDVPWGMREGTVATSGCSITCAAMIISYLTDTEILPDELASDYNFPGLANTERMEAAFNDFGIDYTMCYNWIELKDAIADGCVAIVMVNSNTPFTSGQHMIVIESVNEDGTVMIKDPNGAAYRRKDWYMDKCIAEGFPDRDFDTGFQGGWVFAAKGTS